MTPDERDDQTKYTTMSARRPPVRGADYGVEAGAKYDDDVRRFVAGGQVEPAAEAARRAIEGPEGPALHQAEVTTARHGAMPGDPLWVTKLRDAAHQAIDRMLSGVVRVQQWVKSETANPRDRISHRD